MDATETADRDRTGMRADRGADVIADRVRVAADVIATVIVDRADRDRMVVAMAHRPRVGIVARAKNIVTETQDDTRVMDRVTADQIVIVTDNVRRADLVDVTVDREADDRSMRADRAKVDGRKVRADAPITRVEATVDRDDMADDRSPNTPAARSLRQRKQLRRGLAKKFRDSLRSYSAEASRLNL